MFCKSLGCLACYGVGIGVQNVSHAVVCQRSHDRHNSSFYQGVEFVAVCPVNVAYETIVNAILQRTLV